MRTRWFAAVALAIPFLMASLCTGTSESVLEPSADEFTKTVTLVNADVTLCVHIFAPGETFPCCQVCNDTGGRRTVVMNLTRQQTYTFRAGRNGQILAEQVCRAVGAETDSFDVVWAGAELLCGGGFS